MPIFMERHDMSGLTAEDVAEARDLEVQGKYGVKYMTYWYDAARGAGFVLWMRRMPRLQRMFTARLMARFRPKSSRLNLTSSKPSWAGSPIRVSLPATPLPDWMLDCAACW